MTEEFTLGISRPIGERVNIFLTMYRTSNSNYLIKGYVNGYQSKPIPVLYDLNPSLKYQYFMYLSFYGPVGVRSMSPKRAVSTQFWHLGMLEGIIGHQLNSILAKKNVRFSFNWPHDLHLAFSDPLGKGQYIRNDTFENKFLLSNQRLCQWVPV